MNHVINIFKPFSTVFPFGCLTQTAYPNILWNISPLHNNKVDKKGNCQMREGSDDAPATALFCWSHSHFSLDLIAKVDNTALSNRHSGAEQWGHRSFSGFMKRAS